MLLKSRSEEEKFDDLTHKELLLKKLHRELSKHEIEKEEFKEMMSTLNRLLSEE